MQKLSRGDLLPLEQYAQSRPEFRRKAMEHKRSRRLPVGPDATLYFEDRLTVQYQVQEMLRIEKIFEPAGIEDELGAYNPLIPDGRNWKATFMVEFEDPAERRVRLAELVGVEDKVWVKVDGHERVRPVADEDMDRDTADKTASVHFLRFELTPDMVKDLKGGASLAAGIDHEHYDHTIAPVPSDIRDSLVADLD
jgi:hypothetical protein